MTLLLIQKKIYRLKKLIRTVSHSLLPHSEQNFEPA